MKKIELPDNIKESLILAPETGMGYQTVSLTLNYGRRLEHRIVLNSEYLVLHEDENFTTDDILIIELEQ